MDDASLDDFLGSDDEEESATEIGDTPDGDSEATADTDPEDLPDSPRVDPATVEPATVTSRWDGDGVACSSCGERVDRGWVSAAGIVCPACKEWS